MSISQSLLRTEIAAYLWTLTSRRSHRSALFRCNGFYLEFFEVKQVVMVSQEIFVKQGVALVVFAFSAKQKNRQKASY